MGSMLNKLPLLAEAGLENRVFKLRIAFCLFSRRVSQVNKLSLQGKDRSMGLRANIYVLCLHVTWSRDKCNRKEGARLQGPKIKQLFSLEAVLVLQPCLREPGRKVCSKWPPTDSDNHPNLRKWWELSQTRGPANSGQWLISDKFRQSYIILFSIMCQEK